ncbi:hypothetical protein PtB15_6B501 [Puccinia triticina]|nr:hypothetical protein PtB15_6B501 [Puccinia triticina]
MWLPRYLLAFASISQLIINIDASLDATTSALWLCDRAFFPDDEGVRHALRMFPGITTDYWRGFSSGRGISSEEAAIADFNKQWLKAQASDSTTHQSHQAILVKTVINYLLFNQSMSTKDLLKWCNALETTVIKHYQAHGKLSDFIIFAFHTLLLRHRNVKGFWGKLNNMVDRIKKGLGPHPYNIPWAHELYHPHLGVNGNFRIWKCLGDLISDEPRLKLLGEAINNYPGMPPLCASKNVPEKSSFSIGKLASSLKQLKVGHKSSKAGEVAEEVTKEVAAYRYITENINSIFTEIFLREPAKDLSSQTRVVSIAVLFYLRNTDMKTRAVNIAQSIIQNPGLHFLFDYEHSLLQNLLKHA